MLSILHYKLHVYIYEASKMGRDFKDTLYNIVSHFWANGISILDLSWAKIIMLSGYIVYILNELR